MLLAGEERSGLKKLQLEVHNRVFLSFGVYLSSFGILKDHME